MQAINEYFAHQDGLGREKSKIKRQKTFLYFQYLILLRFFPV
jgi:hypothetical protein